MDGWMELRVVKQRKRSSYIAIMLHRRLKATRDSTEASVPGYYSNVLRDSLCNSLWTVVVCGDSPIRNAATACVLCYSLVIRCKLY